jgi:hypothetical protein
MVTTTDMAAMDTDTVVTEEDTEAMEADMEADTEAMDTVDTAETVDMDMVDTATAIKR